MSENRVRRVAEQIKKDISVIIASQIKDPRIASIVSVTEVRLSRDLRYATVYVSVFGSDEEREETMRVLERATGYIRGEIGRLVRLRYTPEISFQPDKSIEYGSHIENVIRSIRSEEGGGDEGSTPDH